MIHNLSSQLVENLFIMIDMNKIQNLNPHFEQQNWNRLLKGVKIGHSSIHFRVPIIKIRVNVENIAKLIQ